MQTKYNAILKRHYEAREEIPPEAVICKELGISVQRLRTVLRYTQALVSIEAPFETNDGAGKGGKAGGDIGGGNDLLLSDTLQWYVLYVYVMPHFTRFLHVFVCGARNPSF